MTPKYLKAIRDRWLGATMGIWKIEGRRPRIYVRRQDQKIVIAQLGDPRHELSIEYISQLRRNAVFITHARNDISDLVTEINHLQKIINEIPGLQGEL